MWEQLLKPQRLPAHRADRDIEEPKVVIRPALVQKAEKGKKLGPRTRDPSLPYGVTANQARALDAVVTHGDYSAAAVALGLTHYSIRDAVTLAYRRIPGPHRLAKLIAWARARDLHLEKAE